MKAEYEQHWHEVAQEVLLEMNSWREEHPTATMQEIEEEVYYQRSGVADRKV